MTSFDDVNRLDPPALDALLEGGAPDERLWAVWALALRGQESVVVRRIAIERDAGVRRAIAVILASHGDARELLDLARDDAQLVVRQTAIQLALRCAVGGRLPIATVLEVAARQPQLELALLGAMGAGAPPALVDHARALLVAPERELALEAFEALVRIATPAAREAARAWLLAQRDLPDAMQRWLRAASVESLAHVFAAEAPLRRARVLAILHAPPWAAVEVLLGDDIVALRDAVVNRADIAVPAVVLARSILAGAHFGFVPRLTAQLHAAGDGLAVLQLVRGAIDRADTGDLRTLAARVRVYAAALELRGAPGVLDQLVELHPVEHLMGLEHAVATWVDTAAAPADLLDLVPELQRHCTVRLARVAPTPNLQQLALQAPGDAPQEAPWDEGPALRALLDQLRPLLPDAAR